MRFIKWEITNQCNLRCKHCLVGNQLGSKDTDITLDKARHVLTQAASLGASHLFLLGGEPLTRADIARIIDFASSKGLSVHVVTNGQSLSSDLFRRLVDAGLSELTISIDGPNSSVYDPIRGNRAFSRLKRNLDEVFSSFDIVNTDFSLSANTVVDKRNTSRQILSEFIGLLSEYPFSLWRLLALQNLGSAHDSYATYVLRPPEKIAFARTLALLLSEQRPHFAVDPQFMAPLVWHYLRITGTNLPWPQVCCDAASDMLFIDGKGFVQACDLVRHLPNVSSSTSLHRPLHVSDQNIGDIVLSEQSREMYRFISGFYSDVTYEPCKKCYYREARRCEPCPLYSLEGNTTPYEACLYVSHLMEEKGMSISDELSLPDCPERRKVSEIDSNALAPADSHLVPYPATHVRSIMDGDSCLIYNDITQEHYRISGIAAIIYLLADGTREVIDIIRMMEGLYSDESEIKKWVTALVANDLLSDGKIELSACTAG